MYETTTTSNGTVNSSVNTVPDNMRYCPHRLPCGYCQRLERQCVYYPYVPQPTWKMDVTCMQDM